jgi:glycosyltransferase involved in cell wall biosynthesis
MRILHVTTYLQGGAGRVIADLAIQQRRAGHDVIVVADSGNQPGYGSYPEYLEALRRAGVEQHAVRSTFTRDVPLNVDAAGELSRLIGNRQIDVVHAHAAIPAMVARLGCGSRATPIVVTVHGWGIAKTADQARTDVTLLGLADVVVTPSAALRVRLQRLGVRQNALVVPYGIGAKSSEPIDDADAARLASIRGRAERIVVCIGTVGERKNQRLLVQALTKEGCRDLHAVFVGEGETSTLRADAVERGVEERVHVLGHRVDASRYLQHADVVALPSRDEGLPLVLLEAMREGVPIVASDIPEIFEALGDGRYGYVFSGGSAAALADALERALSLAAFERFSLASEQRLRWQHSHRLEQMAAAYHGIYSAQATARLMRISPRDRAAIGRPA